MKIQVVVIAASFGLLASQAEANCYGTSAFSTCYDSSGNSYNIQRYGGSTYMQGSNPGAGSIWSQESHTYGGTTMHSGRSSDGGSWNMTQQRIGNMQMFSGTDSDGRSFNYTCDRFGCR